MEQTNILLVDDQPGKLLSYQAILADLGENLVTAKSGREALHSLLKQEFALILLDVVMPEMDGFETAALIRQRPRLEHTPIIFVTAYSTSDLDRIKGYELGAVDYVFAPIVPEILRAKVAAFVELYRNRRVLAKTNEQLRAEIEERQLAEDRLRRSEERFRLMVENVQDYAIFMLDPEGHVATWNTGAERLHGYRLEEIIGEHFSRFYQAADVQQGRPDRELQTAADEGRFEDEGWRVRKDGSLCYANVMVTALRDPAGKLIGFAKLTHDLTERKRAQERALQTERLAAIGQMVTGLAHESRNALQQIQSSVEMLARRVRSNGEFSLVTEIQKAHDRIHHLLEGVRGYAAPIKIEYETHDLRCLWQEAWHQLAPMNQGRAVEFQEDTGGLDLRCPVGAFHIERLFRNILENSLAACGDPCKIAINCRAAKLHGRDAIQVRITDNGPGINAEQKDRLFEPFYTTKTNGTGLGMAIAARIVEAHGGQIAVDADSGSGLTIEVLLPKGQT
jgi:PAS domain S-box-containing protein